jgi:hypothetical protein
MDNDRPPTTAQKVASGNAVNCSTSSAFYHVITGNSGSDVRQYGKRKSKNAFYYAPALSNMKLEFAL